jgi:hypothetical protein
MNFWEENKVFVIVAGVVLVAFLYLSPSLIGEWLAPWRGPVVVRLNATEYADLERRQRQRDRDIKEIFHPDGQAVPVAEALTEAVEANEVLLDNYQEMHRWMSFVPRFPFRILEGRKELNERQRYVSRAYTYARTGEFPCPEFEIRDYADGIVWLAETRNVGLGDEYFGLRNMERAGEITDPEKVIKHVALIPERGHLAISVGVDEIAAISPGDPYAWGIEDTPVATAYPVTVRIKCNLPTLLTFVHALDGAHGLVEDVQDLGVAAAAAAPVKPEGPTAPETATVVVIQIHGQPSLAVPDKTKGDLKERFTLFRPSEADPHELEFVANAVLRRVLPGGKVEAEIEDLSDLRFTGPDERKRVAVRAGDFAATRFFLVRSLKVKSVKADIETNQDGFPEEVVPAHLDAELSVAAVRFLKAELPAADKRGGGKKPPAERKREFKKPGPRL